ncbi:MAG: hypothetical protein M1831_004310 [Alyxoria varia]|nr:MAG: hypothetical protein M1831_004310 [Alyxoria varia]
MASPDQALPSPSLDHGSPEGQSPGSMSLGNINANNRNRPPRKSTLTQQQKNQKRQRATQDQLGTLEIEFNKNPTPTAMVRERIAQDINMTERSVQIWFQNRRAKIKNIAKKSLETGEDCDAIPESMRKYLAMQALESGKPLVRDLNSPSSMGPMSNGLIMNADSQAKVLISHLQCRSLSIGSWRRISQTALDLVVFYSPAKSMFTYYINADSSGFKIEYPFSSIKTITLDTGDASAGVEGASQRSGGLIVELTQPPTFSMDPGSGGFFQCRDFTEDQQATKVLTHHLGGHSKILSGQLAKLINLDSFRNRHRAPEPPNLTAASAPVSPITHRPASQPNHLMHPHMNNQPPSIPENTAAMAPPPSRAGHKRQRSRSVPIPFDHSQLRRPLPPFLQAEMPHHLHQQNNMQQQIFAPVPQYAPTSASNTPMNGFTTPVGSGLTINSSAAGYDFNPGPRSATTVNSFDFEHPLFTAGPPSEAYSTPNLNTPYSATFLSPMVNPSSLNNPPGSPFSTLSHGDPVIANHSPPLGMDRSASADIYHQNAHDQGIYNKDEGLNINELYTKQPPFQLPFRSADGGEPAQEPDFDFQNMVHFEPNSVSLSPDNSGYSNNS